MENKLIRQKAASVWKSRFGTLVCMLVLLCVTAIVLGTLANMITSLLTPTIYINIDAMTGELSLSADVTMGELMDSLGWILLVTSVVSLVLTTVMMALYTGMLNGFIGLMRGVQTRATVIYSRLRYCLKALGLMLWVWLKMMLWLLLPLVLLLVIIVVAAVGNAGSGVTETAVAAMAETTILAVAAIYVVMVVMIVWLTLKYAMSFYVLADKPETGILDCVRKSKAMMKGRKWQLLRMCLYYILVMLGVLLALLLVVLVLLAVLGDGLEAIAIILFTLALLVLAFVVGVRMQLAITGFYDAYAAAGADGRVEAEVVLEALRQKEGENAAE